MEVERFAAALLAGYVLGSIPSGLLVGKVLKGVDLREFGSGKTGATNALRTLGIAPTILVVIMDVGKGLAALLLAHIVANTVGAECAAGLAAAVGHNWPVFAGFRGGRGVLVSYAIFWVLCWPAALVSTCIGVGIIVASRFVSLGVLIGTGLGVLAAVPVVVTHHASPWVLGYALLGAALIIARHKDNIDRLRAGTERKLGQRAQPVAS